MSRELPAEESVSLRIHKCWHLGVGLGRWATGYCFRPAVLAERLCWLVARLVAYDVAVQTCTLGVVGVAEVNVFHSKVILPHSLLAPGFGPGRHCPAAQYGRRLGPILRTVEDA